VKKIIDLRSDTVTVPTPEMRKAMATAEVGDDVYRDDPTVIRLEELAAEKLGKEAGLFVPSGTMGNLVSILAYTRPGDEIILEQDAHIFTSEVGGCAALGGVMVRTVPGVKGTMEPDVLEKNIRTANIHHPNTVLICMENTHNRAGGAVVPPEKIAPVREVADKHGLAMHLDGARIFNASVALGVSPVEIARYFDSVQFCISKGLAAPVGSLVVGSKSWIEKARRWRKMVGGGMRQAGIIAAAGVVALETMIDRLVEDHENAQFLAKKLVDIPGVQVEPAEVETNMVRMDVTPSGMTAAQFVDKLGNKGLLANATEPYVIRLVTHKDISRADLEKALPIIAAVAAG
jgi:threonine aldolase